MAPQGHDKGPPSELASWGDSSMDSPGGETQVWTPPDLVELKCGSTQVFQGSEWAMQLGVSYVYFFFFH